MRHTEIENTIRRSLSPKEYKRLIPDIEAAVRAFHVLGEVAPWLPEDR